MECTDGADTPTFFFPWHLSHFSCSHPPAARDVVAAAAAAVGGCCWPVCAFHRAN